MVEDAKLLAVPHIERALEQEPTLSRLTAGLAEEGAVVIASPETPDEMERVIADHAGDRAAENTIENPETIKTETRDLPVAPQFEHTLPAMSVQFIRIKTGKDAE